jgi:molybdopterin biosynthesis enzyme
MHLATLPLAEAVGHILRHNIADAAGRKAIAKGRRLTAEDVAALRDLGIEAVRVAVLEADDVHEDAAAQRLAAAVVGAGVVAGPASHSRVNLYATADGVVGVDVAALLAINDIDGLTVATRAQHTLVRQRARMATIKIIPFAVPEPALAIAEEIGRAAGGVVYVRPLQAQRVGVVLVGSAAAQNRIERGVYPAIADRVTELGSAVSGTRYVAPEEEAVAQAIVELRAAGATLLIVAGETSIMDRDDVTPRGIRRAGGAIEHYGAPVEPGNLLLLAYLPGSGGAPDVPVLGAPGCVRSRDTNIVDLLLPRLAAGERVTRRDVVALGHGGLLG